MLIGTRFQRPGAPIDLPNKDGSVSTYFFRPVDSRNASSEHVADVTDPDHISRLLAIPEGYYVSQAEVALQSVSGVSKPVSPPAQPPPKDETASEGRAPETQDLGEVDAANTGDGDSPNDEGTAPEENPVDDEVEQLLSLSLAAFKAAVKKADRAVLERALAAETAKAEDERATYTKALKAALA